MKPGVRFALSSFLFVPLLFGLAASSAMAQNNRSPVAAPNAQVVVGAPNGRPLSGDTLEATTKEVASLLRCPVCQGLSVWDSPATMAVDMKHEVRELLATGYGQDQILRYFEHSYGEFVLLAPSKEGIALLVWLLPVVLLLCGGVAVWRMTSRAPASELPERGPLFADRELAKYVLAVRALAHGKPWDQ
jgi:cytochrome c-type biogenesis protein CcmH